MKVLPGTACILMVQVRFAPYLAVHALGLQLVRMRAALASMCRMTSSVCF